METLGQGLWCRGLTFSFNSLVNRNLGSESFSGATSIIMWETNYPNQTYLCRPNARHKIYRARLQVCAPGRVSRLPFQPVLGRVLCSKAQRPEASPRRWGSAVPNQGTLIACKNRPFKAYRRTRGPWVRMRHHLLRWAVTHAGTHDSIRGSSALIRCRFRPSEPVRVSRSCKASLTAGYRVGDNTLRGGANASRKRCKPEDLGGEASLRPEPRNV